MPGSIKISAIQVPLSPTLFLKVAVGRREYNGNVGVGDFSFPVISLRDNPIIMVYKADGALISQTELKTREIVERGSWDVTFTLDGGEEVLLRLQFLLSEEERKRIREMRNYALKRKQQEELIRDGRGSSFPGSPSSEQGFTKIPDNSSQVNNPTLRKSSSLDGLQERAILAEKSTDTDIKHEGNTLLQNAGRETYKLEENLIGVHKGKNGSHGRSNDAIKRMISAFESSCSQETRITSHGSLQSMSSMARSSSAGMLSETSLPMNAELSKKDVQNFDSKLEISQKSSISSYPESRQSLRNSQKSRKLSFVAAADESSSSYGVATTSSATEANWLSSSPNAVHGLCRDTEAGTPDEMPHSSLGEMLVSRSEKSIMSIYQTSYASRKKSLSDFHQTKYEISNTSIDISSSGGMHSSLARRELQYTGSSSDENKARVQTVSRHIGGLHSLEQINVISRSRHDDPTNYCFQMFDIRAPHYLCLSTGSRQLRDLFKHCSGFRHQLQFDGSMLITEAEEQQNMQDEEITNNEASSSTTEEMGKLLNQGVRIVIVLIACGAIFVNNR